MGITKTSSLDNGHNFINCVVEGLKRESNDMYFKTYKYENKQEQVISEGKALSGTLISVDAGGYEYEWEWKDQVHFTIEDGWETLRLSLGINSVSRDLLLKLVTLDKIDYVEFELNTYEDKEGKIRKHCNVIINGERIKGSEEHYKKISEGYVEYTSPSWKKMLDATKATEYIIKTLVPLVDSKINIWEKSITDSIREKNDIDDILDGEDLPF